MFQLYYYASIPLVSNLIFYYITSLSTSISSSQNVIKFITEHKDCDSIIFTNELSNLDLDNKLKIIESLVYDIIRKFSVNKEEFDKTKKEILNPSINSKTTDCDFSVIDITSKTTVLDRIDEPIKITLISVSEILQNINEILNDINIKIINYQKSYVKNFVSLSLKQELSKLNKQIKILDIRTNILFDLLKIYLPFINKIM